MSRPALVSGFMSSSLDTLILVRVLRSQAKPSTTIHRKAGSVPLQHLCGPVLDLPKGSPSSADDFGSIAVEDPDPRLALLLPETRRAEKEALRFSERSSSLFLYLSKDLGA